ncbi:MAG: tRNA guanosine(34) transglycosylase Tgt [Bacteroidetes bacterium]|nr:tRNA guanosine(34) transglycosylase Tgt [Bacteroidota bacterium]
MHFELLKTDPATGARAGLLHTDHGVIETPTFMPVGTAGTVKAVHFQELEEVVNADIILGNTYHLYLRPGLEVLQGAGGLHKFESWNRPILTDSGGYQVFSLAARRKITEEGASFQSHIDGSRHLFSPERVVDIQRIIGADIIMAFDECPPWPAEKEYVERSMHLTHRWLERCRQRMRETEPLYGHQQALFPIVQGGTYPELRQASAEYIARLDADGNAIGGLSVGEPAEDMYRMSEMVCGILPADKPRYLMGVGTPTNILENIHLGIDMFDCVMPTRSGRTAQLFTRVGILNMRNAKWQQDHSPIDPESSAPTSRRHSKAYLRHLYISGEMLASQIGTLHNLAFYLELVREARRRILDGSFKTWKTTLLGTLDQRL